MLRVLVCGGRDYSDAGKVEQTLDLLPAPVTLICGMARGADVLAFSWAKSRGFPIDCYPADWQAHGRAAGPIRNQQMIDTGKPDLVIAFPGGAGTQDMMRRARATGIKVRTVE